MPAYLRYVLHNIEPIRIADDSTSQNGQTVSLRYIPGTTIRGLVINKLAKKENFETIKKALLSNEVQFLNAYLTVKDGKTEKELMPSPKGFYEDKNEKELQNVVCKGTFTDGFKRAKLGRYCYIENNCIHYYNVDTGSDMKIKINVGKDEKQNVFRNEYMAANHVFTGYIVVNDSSLKEVIKDVLKETVIIGNSRSAGLGKCKVIDCEYVERIPFEEYLPKEDQENFCYMMLLSNMTMRNSAGELCGLDLKKLKEKMDVAELEMEYCSTSTVNVKGYNRTWGIKIPSVVMYEQGSVFRLTFKGVFEREKMLELCNNGIGIRRNEGFGRILFFENYEGVASKKKEEYHKVIFEEAEKSLEDIQTLKVIAKGYYRNLLQQASHSYILEHPIQKGKLSNSQLGVVESIVRSNKYQPKEAKESLKRYFENAGKKEENQNMQKERNSAKALERYVNHILDSDLEELLCIETKEKGSIMGISKKELFSENEINKIKLTLISDLIRYDNKKEDV